MLNAKLFLVLAISSLMVSCHNNKVLFQTVPENLNVEIPEAVIQIGDILDINITSLNSQSTSIFSPTSLGKIGTIRNLEARKLDGYVVDQSGYIDIPIIGRLHVSAMSCSLLADSIKTKSKEYVLNPNVRVKVLNFRVSVLGEVNSPGSYDVINQKISLLELLSKAGGLSKAADASRVMILRDFNEKVETRYIDLTTLEFINSDFYYLRQNDEIYVLPDRLSQILDYGSLRYMGWGVTTSLVAILNYINS